MGRKGKKKTHLNAYIKIQFYKNVQTNKCLQLFIKLVKVVSYEYFITYLFEK